MQKVAIVAIVLLGCLQFLPATHFRDPNDPHRNWIPFDGSRNPAVRHRAPDLTCSLCLWNCSADQFLDFRSVDPGIASNMQNT
jgi:hypothetical protein